MGLWQQSYLGNDGLESTILSSDGRAEQHRKAVHILQHLAMDIPTRFNFYDELLAEAMAELNKVESLKNQISLELLRGLPDNSHELQSGSDKEIWSFILGYFAKKIDFAKD